MSRMGHFGLKDENAVAARRRVVELSRSNRFPAVCAFESLRELGPSVNSTAPALRNVYESMRVDVKALVDMPIFDAVDLS